MQTSRATFSLLACCLALLAGTTPLQAQTIYRIVGPDGKVTFSDKAPLDAGKATATTAAGKSLATADAGLPYELRQVSSKYPVRLYSQAECVPCNSGRLLLQSRGIPFTEHTISTPEDADALKRLTGDSSLPVLTVGGQKIKGFSESEWVQYLNAANYPATSLLPANYRNAPPRPLVAVQKPAAIPGQPDAQTAAEEKPAATDAPPSQVTGPTPSSPGGIRF